MRHADPSAGPPRSAPTAAVGLAPAGRSSRRVPRRHRRRLVLAGVAVAGAAAAGLVWLLHPAADQPTPVSLPLRSAAVLDLPGGSSRFDYTTIDPQHRHLFIAHLGAGQVIDVDIRANQVVRTISGIAGVHGALVVPSRHRLYATATDDNQVVTLDEDTGTVLARAPTGDYPDGLAYDPTTATVWVTNENGGTETVIDAATGQVRATVPVGGDAGNVTVDPAAAHRPARVLVDVQSRNMLAVIDPHGLRISAQAPLPGCDHDHGLHLDPAARLAFVACDGNDTLLVLDLDTLTVRQTLRVGAQPDVLDFDQQSRRLYVAAESGWVSVFDEHDRHLQVVGNGYLAADAHVVAVDPVTHRTYFPIPDSLDGHPALLVETPQ